MGIGNCKAYYAARVIEVVYSVTDPLSLPKKRSGA